MIFHTRLSHNLIKILSFQVWVNASLNLESFHLVTDHVLVSDENRRSPPGNHKRRGYCVWSIFKVICHFHLAAILHFGKRKNGNYFFLNPHV